MQEQLENEGEQQQCSNCLKHFPVDKIDLHEAYCCRNIRKCTQCSAMIDIKDMEDHIVNLFSLRLKNIPKNHVHIALNNSNQPKLLNIKHSVLRGQ